MLRSHLLGAAGALLVVLVLLVAACGSDPRAPVFPDRGVVDPGPLDPGFLYFDSGDRGVPDPGQPDPGAPLDPGGANTDTGPAPGAFLHPCDFAIDCDSGKCVVTALGQGRVCSRLCEEGCPADMVCGTHTTAGGTATQACLFRTAHLCRPCAEDAQCRKNGGDPGARCLSFGALAGSFCTVPCAEEEPCPDRYRCEERVDPVSGVRSHQCLPKSGVCRCSPVAQAEKASTPCGIGLCAVARTCSEEILPKCAPNFAAPEICDGLDNDCNGDSDEPFLVGGVYLHNEHCGACGKSCKDLIAHGETACELVGGEPRCSLLSCDLGFFEIEPGVCSPTDAEDCRPCEMGVEGACPAGTECRAVGAGSFCTRTCTPAGGCPDGFGCAAPVLDGGAGGGADMLCLRGRGCGFPGKPCQKDWECEDLKPCTEVQCTQGKCIVKPASCDDQDPCTEDSCVKGKGCAHAPLTDVPCEDDGTVCTVDVCKAGLCTHQVLPGPAPCPDDGSPCTKDVCSQGICVHPPVPGGEPCDDGDPCTDSGTCVQGYCKAGAPKDGDHDTFIPVACGGKDCDDTRPDINPDAAEICDDGADNDCDGLTDGQDLDCP